jgi:hypothetical protein
MVRSRTSAVGFALLVILLFLPVEAQGQETDPFLGSFFGQHWLGMVSLEVQKNGAGYTMVYQLGTAAGVRIPMMIDAEGALYGEQGRERFWIRRDGSEFRFRARGMDIAVEKHSISDGSPLAAQWVRDLGGKRLVQLSSSYDSSSGSSRRVNIHLCSNGQFHFDYQSSFRASTGGVSASSNNSDSAAGRWRVFIHNSMPILELRSTDGEVVQLIPNVRGDQFFLDDERTFVEAPTVCP